MAQEGSKGMSPVMGLGIVLAVVVVVGAYVGLNMALGIAEGWAGFLFLLCWSMIEKGSLDRFAHALVGALIGAGTAALMKVGPEMMGPTGGMVLFLGVVLLLIYAIVMGWFALGVNTTTMVFLTVGTIPYVEKGAEPAGIFLGIASGAVFFGALGLIGAQIGKRRQAKATSAEPVSI
ncbi:hypothetical protein [Flavisphingomonas formosensis]|uniref:hypothetical protein n=1 Tax=Flavisphingomonas formosensis TaxID=861534 RepID=UPI0012FCFD79|nr:hypothetical protein [Sphingomonas formosensis]